MVVTSYYDKYWMTNLIEEEFFYFQLSVTKQSPGIHKT